MYKPEACSRSLPGCTVAQHATTRIASVQRRASNCLRHIKRPAAASVRTRTARGRQSALGVRAGLDTRPTARM
eukprot:scaffold615590_cov42-Prasinocladus_malaysianus.AAC.1